MSPNAAAFDALVMTINDAPRAIVIRATPAATHSWRQGYANLRKDATL